MNKSTLNLEEHIILNKVIPVVAMNEINEALELTEILLKLGINIIEVVLRTPNALKIITAISREMPEILVGAGTILSAKQYNEAIDAGAKFTVSPGITLELIEESKKFEIPFIAGAITPSEVMQAYNHNLRYLKFFPSHSFNVMSTLESYVSVFPEVKFCLTGGIDISCLHEYFSLPNVFAIGTSALNLENLIKDGKLTPYALNFQQTLQNLNNKK